MDEAARFRDLKQFTAEDLTALLAYLRGPDGCPWDRAQTHASLRPYLLEEAQEAAEAIDGGDPDALCEELGDVLLQVLFHARVAEEQGRFDWQAVCTRLGRKLVARHSHVFGADRADSAASVAEIWQRNKARERAEKEAAAAETEMPRAAAETAGAAGEGTEA